MKKHLHFKDEKSDKFWKIEVNGNAHTVSYGRTGTNGQSKTKTFEDSKLAQKDAEKLINSKIKKGYVDIVDAVPAQVSTSANANPADTNSAAKKSVVASGTGNSPAKLTDKPIVEYVHGQPFNVSTSAPKIVHNPHADENSSWDEKFTEFLMVQDAAATTHFVAGIACEAYEEPNTDTVLKSLVKHKDALPNLISLFLNDIESEECELSWIVEGNLTPVWKNFPKLREFKIRGYPGEMGEISMPYLEKFTIECSGMKKANLQQLFKADMPNLTHLDLWIGTDEYGGETNADDWGPLLSGELFPKLKYLGLRNCVYADNLAKIIANSPILDRIETLDLSLGTLGDEGGVALYQSDKIRALKHLDLEHHFMSDWMMGRYQGVDKPIPKARKAKKPAAQPAQPAQATQSGGFLSKLFGKSAPPPPPPPPVQEAAEESEAPKNNVDYASIPLIPAGQFGPTVSLGGQEDPYEYDDEEWRYVAYGE